MKYYLYGAAVQGIQSFIFSSNDLKSIVGASELVEEICTTMFDEFAGEGKSIIRAAGNIKYLFTKEEDCKKAVLKFPKKVMTEAPGITISQAVVVVEGDSDAIFEKAVDELESRLRQQRNKPVTPLTLGLTGIQRSRQTGLPVAAESGSDHFDYATLKKLAYTQDANEGIAKKMFGDDSGKTTTNITKLTGQNDWIAIIHADGNGLGKIVAKIGKNRDLYIKFSQALDKATQKAAQKAYETLDENLKTGFKEDIIPIRPLILGGDDFTVVCRADVAVPLVKAFMKNFEEETLNSMGKEILKDFKFKKLTACAGIAYIKSSYPFYYGYNLAEALCDEAKKDAKKEEHLVDGLAASCLMFHKVQDSFVESYSRIATRELTPYEGHSFVYGPYYLADMKERSTIDDLLETKNTLIGLQKNKDGNAVKSHLRQWMSIMSKDPEIAKQKRQRVLDMLGERNAFYGLVKELTTGVERLDEDNEETYKCYPVYDLLSLVSIDNQVTKIKKEKK